VALKNFLKLIRSFLKRIFNKFAQTTLNLSQTKEQTVKSSESKAPKKSKRSHKNTSKRYPQSSLKSSKTPPRNDGMLRKTQFVTLRGHPEGFKPNIEHINKKVIQIPPSGSERSANPFQLSENTKLLLAYSFLVGIIFFGS
jgi:hypothetical protein